jgi:hypothetical protein
MNYVDVMHQPIVRGFSHFKYLLVSNYAMNRALGTGVLEWQEGHGEGIEILKLSRY